MPMNPELRALVERLATAVGWDTREGFTWHRSHRGFWELRAICPEYPEPEPARAALRTLTFLPWHEKDPRGMDRWFREAPSPAPEDPTEAVKQLLAMHDPTWEGDRYRVVHASERSPLDRNTFGADCWHLVDGRVDRTVWSDGDIAPEDAILPRGLNDLVDLLNGAS